MNTTELYNERKKKKVTSDKAVSNSSTAVGHLAKAHAESFSFYGGAVTFILFAQCEGSTQIASHH